MEDLKNPALFCQYLYVPPLIGTSFDTHGFKNYSIACEKIRNAVLAFTRCFIRNKDLLRLVQIMLIFRASVVIMDHHSNSRGL